MTDSKNRLVKKTATIGINALIGGLLAGGGGALVGIISSVDSGFIGAAIDKFTAGHIEAEEAEEEEVQTSNAGKATSATSAGTSA